MKKTIDDTSRIRTEAELAIKIRFTEPDTAMKLATSALKQAEDLDYLYGRARSTYAVGAIYYKLERYDMAIEYYAKAIPLYSKLRNLKIVGDLYSQLGRTYYDIDNITLALEFDFKSLKQYEEINEQNGQAVVLGNIGTIHHRSGDFKGALEYHKQALAIDEKLDIAINVIRHIGNVGSVYLDMAADLKKSGKQQEADLAYKSAFEWLSKALTLAEKEEDENAIAMNIGNIAGLFHDSGDKTKALEWYTKALEIETRVKNKEGMARNLGNMGWLFLDLGEYEKAEAYTLQALSIIDSSDFLQLRSLWNINLSNIYEKTKKFDLSLKYFKIGMMQRDSLFNIESAKKELETEMKYKFQKKEAISKQEADMQKIIRNSFIAAFALMLCLALFVLRGYRQNKKTVK